MNVTACIPTRGNVDMTEILASLPKHWSVDIYDNSQETFDLQVLGRYISINRVRNEVVYTQDDDCILSPESFKMLEEAYEPGILVANMPDPFRAHYTDSCLVGFGAIFDRYLPQHAFDRLPENGLAEFQRTCDVYFTTLTSQKWVDVPYTNLPWATGDDRMYRQLDHYGSRTAALMQARALRDA